MDTNPLTTRTDRPETDALDAVASYLLTLSAGSRRSQAGALRTVETMIREVVKGGIDAAVQWHRLNPAALDAVRARLAATVAPATANRHLSAVRGVLRQCWRHGLIDLDTMTRLADLPPVKGSRLPAGRCVPVGEQSRFFAACADDRSAAGVRDAAIGAILLGAGLRRSEVVGLTLGDIDRGDWSIRLVGKGGKERRFFVRNGTREALQAWLEVRGEEEGPLFNPIHRSGSIQRGRGMTPQAIYAMLEVRCSAAGIPVIRPHDARRTLISSAMDRGIDLSTIAAMVGHASVTTTQRYDRRGDRAREEAASSLTVPYRRTAKN